MNTLLILSTQTTAILEISALLLGAVIIGYVTSWYYYRWIYTKKIEILALDIEAYKKQLEINETEKRDLQKNISEKDSDIMHLSKEVRELKALYTDLVNETETMNLKNNRTEQKLHDKNEELAALAQRKYLLDYNSFGKALGTENDDLKMISGIGPFIEERLHALDIFTYKQISRFTKKDIETINTAIEYFLGRIERDEWVAQAKELVRSEKERIELLERIRAKKSRIYFERIGLAKKEEADDLTEISGIGGWINEKLNALDIYTFRQISKFNNADVQIVTEAIEFFPGRIERDEWVQQARELIRIDISMSEHLEQISVMKNRIYYDRLGKAHKHHANNLTLINGISLWLEERLNLLEIYTFKQLSNLTTEDIEIISSILDISPNRIQQDKWVDQALELIKSDHKIMV